MKFLSPVDAAWFRLDERRNTADIVALITFKEPLDSFHVIEIIEQRFSQHIQFRSKVVDPIGAGLPYWEEVENFRVTDHIHHIRLDSGTTDELQELVGTVLTRDLKRDQPLWEIHIVDNVGQGGAIIAKIHHCLGDGFALVGLLLSLSDNPPGHGSPTSHEKPKGFVEQARFSAKVATGIAELVALPFDTKSSLVQPLTGVRRAAWSDGIPLSTFKDIANARHCTVNDVLMGALTGALRSWMMARGDHPDEAIITAIIPVNLRPEEQSVDELGNQFGLVFLDLPVRKAEPLQHLADVHEGMCAIKQSALAVSSVAVLSALGFMPERVEHLATDIFTRKGSLVVTNVPGPRERLSLAGKEVDQLMFWVPHVAHLGLGISLLSYAQEVRIGVRTDTGICEDPKSLVNAFHEAIQTLKRPTRQK